MQKRQLNRTYLKLISLFCATTLWFYVLSSESLVVEKNLKIEFDLPPGKALAKSGVWQASLKMKGPRVFLRNAFNSDSRILVDLNKSFFLKKKKFTISLVNQKIPLPLGVELLKIVPKSIKVELGRQISKKLTVKPTFIKKVDSGLRLIKYGITPPMIMVKGAKSVINHLTDINSTPIDLSTLKGDGSVLIYIADLDPRIDFKSSKALKFHYSIKPTKANLTLKKIKIRFLSSRKITSSIKHVSLDVLIPEGREQEIKSSEVQVIADIPEDKKGTFKVKLKAMLPEDIHLLQIYPELIKVSVGKH